MLAEARTLVVEDEAMIALDLQNMLKNLGYEVSDPASSGAEALAVATAERSELALMDIRIKGPIDGVEIARELGSVGDRSGAIFFGRGFLQKPLSLAVIARTVRDVLDGQLAISEKTAIKRGKNEAKVG